MQILGSKKQNMERETKKPKGMDKVMHIGYKDRWRAYWGWQILMRQQRKWRIKERVQEMLIKTNMCEVIALVCLLYKLMKSHNLNKYLNQSTVHVRLLLI